MFLINCFCLYDRDSGSAENLGAHQKTPPNRQPKSPVATSQFPLKDGQTDTTKLASKFEEGQDVLARWSDGLFYLGTIEKVTCPVVAPNSVTTVFNNTTNCPNE